VSKYASSKQQLVSGFNGRMYEVLWFFCMDLMCHGGNYIDQKDEVDVSDTKLFSVI